MLDAHVDLAVVGYLRVKRRADLQLERVFCYSVVCLVPG